MILSIFTPPQHDALCLTPPSPYPSNFCVQHMLVHGDSSIRREVIKRVGGSVVSFSLHKFASNVIERCIDVAYPEELVSITYEICASTLEALNASPMQSVATELPHNGQPATALQALVRDRFGNYIIQRLLGVLVGKQLVMLCGVLNLHRVFILGGPHGKQLMAAVAKQSLRITKASINTTLEASDGLLYNLHPSVLHKLGLRPQ